MKVDSPTKAGRKVFRIDTVRYNWPMSAQGRYKIRKGTERRNGTNKTISCIKKVIKFVEYIRFQLRRLPKQFINMHNVHIAE